MKYLRYVLVIASVLTAGSAYAESLGKIGFELYSWQAGSNWNYAVFEGTATPHSLQSIQAPKNLIKNKTYLKGRLAALPEGEIVYWRVDKSRGLRLPPQELVHELVEYAKTAQIKLLLPGQTPAAPAAQEINSDLQRIAD